jgi:hypothetical protein
MSREQIEGIVRHLMGAIGSVLATKGIVDESGVQALVGVAVAVVGVVWSFMAKKQLPSG